MVVVIGRHDRDAPRRAGDAGLPGDVGERPVAVVPDELQRGVARNDKVQISVVIEIDERRRRRPSRVRWKAGTRGRV